MNKEFTFQVNFQKIILILVIFGLGLGLGLWAPWQNSGPVKTIDATGTATLKAEPDEFIFYPSYTATGKDAKAATTAVRKIGDKVVEKLKQLGVDESSIKTDFNSYRYYYRPDGTETNDYQANYSLTITLSSKELSQKTQDYLLTTQNQGSSTPQSQFSTAKQTELKSEARIQAVNNAKTQATELAGELDMKLGKAIDVKEVSGFDIYPIMYGGRGGPLEFSIDSADSQTPSSRLLPGLQDLTFSVKVVFEVN